MLVSKIGEHTQQTPRSFFETRVERPGSESQIDFFSCNSFLSSTLSLQYFMDGWKSLGGSINWFGRSVSRISVTEFSDNGTHWLIDIWVDDWIDASNVSQGSIVPRDRERGSSTDSNGHGIEGETTSTFKSHAHIFHRSRPVPSTAVPAIYIISWPCSSSPDTWNGWLHVRLLCDRYTWCCRLSTRDLLLHWRSV